MLISDSVRQRIDLSREVGDDEIREMIDELVVQMGRKYALSLAQRQETTALPMVPPPPPW